MWKYANPGDYQLLDDRNGTTYANIVDSTKSPRTGIAYTTSSQEDSPISVPDGTKEVWLKMDVFVADNVKVMLRSRTTAYAVTASLSETGWSLNAGYRGYDFANQRFTILEDHKSANEALEGKVVTLELHLRSRALNEANPLNGADGFAEMRINHKIVAKIDNIALFNGEDIKLDTIASNFATSYFSNIIVSSSEIQGREHVAILPIREVTLDGWTQEAQDGSVISYKATGVNQSISQKLDIGALKEVVGESIDITSVNLSAFGLSTDNPDEVDTIEKLVSVNGTEYSIGTTAIDGGAAVTEAITRNPASGEAWNLTDLENLELILRTAKSES